MLPKILKAGIYLLSRITCRLDGGKIRYSTLNSVLEITDLICVLGAVMKK